MGQTAAEPHLTAILRAPQTELDLLGMRSFNLELAVTLHASNAIRLYAADTFLSPWTALLHGGIDFVPEGRNSGPVPRSTIDVNRGNELYRSWSPDDFLTLKPGNCTLINIPFGSQDSSTASESRSFDLRLWINASAFKTGESYKPVLPSAVKVSWWCWATPHEVKDHAHKTLHGLSAACTAVRLC
jgi:hypothetical protein